MVVDAKARYKENFCVDGLLYANNPARLNYIKKPAFARGFCEVHDTLQHQLVLGWLMYDEKSGYYCCPECYGKKHPDPVDRKKRLRCWRCWTRRAPGWSIMTIKNRLTAVAVLGKVQLISMQSVN